MSKKKKYIVDCMAPDVHPTDVPWSKVFMEASKKLDYYDCEFLCWALCQADVSANQKLRMQAYVGSLLGPCASVLESWVIQVWDLVVLESVGQRDPGLIKTRKAWARALSRQFKKAGL